MQAQQQPLTRADSPSDNANNNNLHHIHNQDNIFNLHSQQNTMYNNVNPEYPSDQDQRQQQQHSAKINGFGPVALGPFRSSSFNAFPNSSRSRLANSYRDGPTSFYPTSTDVFPPQMTSPTQSHMQPFDPRGSFDFGGPQSNAGANLKSYGIDPFSSSALLQSHQVGGKPLHPQQQQQQQQQQQHHNGYPPQATQYGNGMHLSSQTPYGPHVPINAPTSASMNGNGAGPGAPPGISAPVVGMNGGNAPTNSSQEEISTIFVVGFPEDMQEREFQNMFTFSPGFEAATLKIPNKEYTAYGGVVGAPVQGAGSLGIRPGGGGAGYGGGYTGSNDPYNLVTVNQGGVVVDGGRDGTVASWPAAAPGDDGGGGSSNHYMSGGIGGAGGLSMPPRKQIIGFAKFKTREEALQARDVLQGRRVDIEKGAVLKAEMAKKNLHTKRGVGPVPGVGNGTGVGGAGGIGVGGGLSQSIMTGAGLGGGEQYGMGAGMGVEVMSPRDRELGTLGAMGLGLGGRMSQWRDQMDPNTTSSLSLHINGNGREREDDERRREREVGVINAMGLGVGSGTRGPRERAEEDERERERRRKEKEREMRLRAGNSTAFDAFHSVPSQVSRQVSQLSGAGGLLSPTSSNSMLTPLENGLGVVVNTSPMLGNGFGHMLTQSSVASMDDTVGPWDGLRKASAVPIPLSSNANHVPIRPPSSSRRSSSPIPTPNSNNSEVARSYSPSLESRSNHPFGQQKPPRYHHVPEQLHHHSQSESSASSVAGGSQSSGAGNVNGNGVEGEMSRAISGLAVSTNHGNTSPQLPSPASGASSGSARNVVDQNPPINTLYVGNLPTSPPPPGYPQDHLEESLRELFASRPGFRKLCFRQKNNGPMCFVEFEDVNHATKTLNDLYGNTLNGLIKGGGIRLSYSKNPLGVRTPTSAGSNGPSLQQQQLQSNSHQQGGASPFPPDAFQPRQSDEQQRPTILRRDMTAISPPPAISSYNNYMMSPPPPRFFSPTPSSTAFGTSSTSTLTGTSSAFYPRSNNSMSLHGFSLSSNVSTFSPFGLSSPAHSTIPDQSTDQPHHEQQQHHYIHRALSPPANNIEAARAG